MAERDLDVEFDVVEDVRADVVDVVEVRQCVDPAHHLFGAVALNFGHGFWQVVHHHSSQHLAGDAVEGWVHLHAD